MSSSRQPIRRHRTQSPDPRSESDSQYPVSCSPHIHPIAHVLSSLFHLVAFVIQSPTDQVTGPQYITGAGQAGRAECDQPHRAIPLESSASSPSLSSSSLPNTALNSDSAGLARSSTDGAEGAGVGNGTGTGIGTGTVTGLPT